MKTLFYIGFLIFLYRNIYGYEIQPEYTLLEINNKKGLLDNHGKLLIPADYENIGWSEGELTVNHNRIGYCQSGKWGIIKLNNEKITEAKFLSLFPGNEMDLIASVHDSYKLIQIYGLIDYDGKPLTGFEYNIINPAGDYFIAGIRNNNTLRFGVINNKGDITISVLYNRISNLGKNLFAVFAEPNKILLQHGSGKILTQLSADDIESFNQGFAKVILRGKYGLINESGDWVLEPRCKDINVKGPSDIEFIEFDEWKFFDGNKPSISFHYDSLIPVSPEKIIAFAGNQMSIVTLHDSAYASFPNVEFSGIYGHKLIIREKKKYGLMSDQGIFFYPAIYDSIICYQNYVLLKRQLEDESGWMMGDEHGEIRNYGLYEQLIPLNSTNILARRKGYWGILDNYGKEKINCIYDSIQQYEDGLIKVIFHGEEGLIWKKKWLVFPGRHHLSILKDQEILISDYRGSLLLNILGDTIFRSENIVQPIAQFFLEKTSDNRYGLIDHEYKQVLYPVFVKIIFYEPDSIFVFCNETGWGAMNNKGKILFSNFLDLDSIISYSEGYFKVLINGLYGFIDLNGKLRVANRYQDAGDFYHGIAPVKILGRWGFINKDEKIIIQPFYDQICSHENKIIRVRKGAVFGLIDEFGEIIQDLDYDSIEFLMDIGYLCIKNNLSGFIDLDGKITIIPRYDQIRILKNNMIIVIRNNKFGLLTDQGDIIIPVQFDALSFNLEFDKLQTCRKNEWKKL